MKRVVAMVAVAAVLAGCGDAAKEKKLQDKVTQLGAEVQHLRKELDEERNGPGRLLVQAKTQIEVGNLEQARKTLEGLIDKHSGSSERAEASTLIKNIDVKIAAIREQERVEKQRVEAEAKAALARLDKNLAKSTDEIKGITWITHKAEPILSKKMVLYFGTKDGSAASYPLRMKIQYYSDDWLFVRSVIVKADDQTFELGLMDFERDNSGGSVWEWSDEQVKNFTFLEATLAAKKVIVRFNGRQYYDDFILPESQKAAMRDVLLAWERYGGKRT